MSGPNRQLQALAAERAFDSAIGRVTRRRHDAQDAIALSVGAQVAGLGPGPSEHDLRHFAACVANEQRLRRAQVVALLARIAGDTRTSRRFKAGAGR